MNNLHYSDEKNILLMVALLKAHNIRRVIASPGTTNITFIGSLMHDPFFEMYSSVDERSAAYIACGMAEERRTGGYILYRSDCITKLFTRAYGGIL